MGDDGAFDFMPLMLGRSRLTAPGCRTAEVRTSGIRAWVHASVAVIALTLGDPLAAVGVAAAPQQPAPQPAPSAEKPVDPAVREALQQYETALESLNADAVKKVQPSIDVEGLKRAFREMRALDVDIDNVRLLSSDQNSARVSCRVAQTLTPKAGSRQTTTVTRVLLLRRHEGGWIIQAFER